MKVHIELTDDNKPLYAIYRYNKKIDTPTLELATDFHSYKKAKKYAKDMGWKLVDILEQNKKSILGKIIEEYSDEEFLMADGFEDAIIGVDQSTMRLVYSIGKCIDILQNTHDMSYEEAQEYFYFNVSGAYVGEKTPIWCDCLEDY